MQTLADVQNMLQQIDQIEVFFRVAMNDPDEDAESQGVASDMILWTASAREVLDGLLVDLQRPNLTPETLAILQKPADVIAQQIVNAADLFDKMGVREEVFGGVQ